MKETADQLRFDENATCDRCGRFGAHVFDGEKLCGECYQSRGSCCPEFGVDDLWTCDASGNRRPEAARKD